MHAQAVGLRGCCTVRFATLATVGLVYQLSVERIARVVAQHVDHRQHRALVDVVREPCQLSNRNNTVNKQLTGLCVATVLYDSCVCVACRTRLTLLWYTNADSIA